MGYKFYMAKKSKGETVYGEFVSIEDYFEGLKYLSCSGLDSTGEPKNIYTETYAETSKLRVWLPDSLAFENTDIQFEFLFIGEKCHDTYHEFTEYVQNCYVKYYDTYRNMEVEMVLVSETEPSDMKLYGDDRYISAKFKFKNINGKATKRVE